MSESTIDQYLSVRGRFHRSVNIEQDWTQAANLSEYLATSTIQELASRIVREMVLPSGSRAWSITGPFGSGKSAFGVFLADVLCRQNPRNPAANQIRRASELGEACLLPVVVVGRRARLAPALVQAVASAINDYDAELARQLRDSDVTDALAVWRILELAQECARRSGFAGLFVVIDEFGRFLEYAALNPSEDDVFVLQTLAEGAARSEGKLLLITIQHSAFGDYLRSATPVQVVEWQKIQGRFTDLAFYLPPEQMIGLLGLSLNASWPADLAIAYEQVVREALVSPALAEAQKRAPLDRLLPLCMPFDPIAVLILWPLFRSKMAQNERSLFAFLTSHEPYGFQEFLSSSTWTGDEPPLYRVDRLHRFVASSIGSSALLGDRARQWAEAENALERLPVDAPVLADSIVRAVALLGLYGSSVGLRADLATLKLALGNAEAVAQAVTYLRQQSIIVYRRHRDDFTLWEGSDVDLDARFVSAMQDLVGEPLAERIERLTNPRPWVARSHYIETGTLRHFDVQFIDGDLERLDGELERTAAHIHGDGTLTFILSSQQADRQRIIERVLELASNADCESQLRVLAIPKVIVGLEDAALELEAWQWVADNEPALAYDRVARDEVRARIVHAQERLEELMGRVFGLPGYPFHPEASLWIHNGTVQPDRSAREFSRWLSELCDQVYDRAPKLRNELLNREQLSSAAAKARRNLLEAMITHESEPQLGLVGYPPEATMYRSLLLAGGFHQQLPHGSWTITRPNDDWIPVWEEIEAFLEDTLDGPLPVTQLMVRLQKPPFGLRAGPVPVVLLAVLLAKRDEVALYEQGTFLPALRIEAIERLLRKPEDFSIRLFKLDETTRTALTALRSAVMVDARIDTSQSEHLISIVKPLVLAASQLTVYARSTRRFDDPRVVEIRQVLLRATDPYALLFEELPQAAGVRLDEPGGAEAFALRIKEAMGALERAYPTLLDEIDVAIRQAFGISSPRNEAAEALRRRAESLRDFSADVRLTTFIREAARQTTDWREGLGRAVMDGRPPSQWKDADVITFRTRLQLIAVGFLRLEELAAERALSSGAPVIHVGILNGHFQEAKALLTVPPEAEAIVGALDELIERSLANSGITAERRDLRMAALARALAREATAAEKGLESWRPN